MRVLICGDRNWTDSKLIKETIEEITKSLYINYIIEGEAWGADKLGAKVAQELGIKVIKYPADWKKYGKAAGSIRNRQMLEEGCPTVVLAFHDYIHKSKGTLHMMKIAMEKKVTVRLISHDTKDIINDN